MASGVSTANITSASTITEVVGNQRLDANNVQTVRVPIDAVANQMVGDGPIADEMASIRDEFVAADQAVEAKISSANLGATQATNAEAIEGTNTAHWMSPGQDKAALDARFGSAGLLEAAALDPMSGYVFAIRDKATARSCLRVSVTGQVQIDDLALLSGAIGYDALDATAKALMFAPLDPLAGYVFAIQDPSTGKAALRIRTDGTVEIDLMQAGSSTVPIAALADDANRQLVPHVTDVVPVSPDDWRATLAGVPVRTAVEGTLWAPLPHVATPVLTGLNGAGTALQFRRSSRLPIRGRRYGGSFDASGTSSNYRGDFTTALPSTTGAAAGDYWIFKDQTSRTLNSEVYNIGDLAVWDGSVLARKAGPTPVGGSAYSNRSPGDWWAVGTAGTFDGVSYAVGDRIVYVGYQSASGYGYARWVKGDFAGRGELFYRGEFDASGGSMPNSPADGEVWQVSVAGTAGGITWTVGDFAVRVGGVWGQVATDAIKAIPSGSFVVLPCIGSASEWEVRRSDKGTTRATTQLSARRQSIARRNLDTLALWSDSLFGVSAVGAAILTAAGRAGDVFSFGGGTSDQVLAMMRYEIARLGDRYRSRVHGFWHGQNNQPAAVGDGNWAQITDCALKMAELVGARDGRFFFMSVLGQHTMAWNGSRLVNAQLEDQFAATGALYALEQWYAAMFPGQWISPRQCLLAAIVGSTKPALQFPGMTEAQVAATYGIVPLRYYAGWSSLPAAVQANPATANFTGYWSTAGLPSGGAAGDYMIRTGNGTVGNLIFNVARTWTEPSLDVTHLSGDGATALSAAVGAFIINSKF